MLVVVDSVSSSAAHRNDIANRGDMRVVGEEECRGEEKANGKRIKTKYLHYLSLIVAICTLCNNTRKASTFIHYK